MYVYRVDSIKTDSFTKLDKCENPWDIVGHCVEAYNHLMKKNIPELSDWNGRGEYWFIELPWYGDFIVLIRPEANPFSEAYLVSPIEIPNEKYNYRGYKISEIK